MELIYLNDDLDSTIERILLDTELENCGLDKEKIEKTLKSFGGDEIATSVFYKKYALRNEKNEIIEFTLEEAKDRWARAVAKAESKFSGKPKEYVDYFRELYNYFLPAGRQMYALGNDYVPKATLSNCYVIPIEEDSIEGIFNTAKHMSKTYAYGGGVGISIGKLRPNGAKVSNSAKYSTGAVSFMDMFSQITNIIGQFNRRGALLLSLPINHPDVEEFIEIKRNTDKVKYANISVEITDDFMNAVINDDEFELKFQTEHEIISKKVNASQLWKKIILSAHQWAEPGILFIDTAKNMSPSDTYPSMRILTTNPCGELFLEKFSCCCLGSILLHKFVKNPFSDNVSFDFDMFEKSIIGGVRHLDNIIELNLEKHALREQSEAGINGRRIGLGITGLADTLAALQIKYDSDEALKFVEKIMNFKMEKEYLASIDLAKERGSFLQFDGKKHFTRGFCFLLPENIKKLGEKGLRNVTISTVAPSGSLSIIAQCSSGIEPIFSLSYKRYVELGNKRKEFNIFHPGVKRYFANTKEKELPDYWRTSHQIDYKFRVKLQGLIQSKTDSSISSTINLPSDVSEEVVSQIYIDAWKEGLKGITVYREGSREGVLVSDEFTKQAGTPDMDTIIRCVRAEGGDKFYIMVSYKNKNIKEPYQVFVLNYKKTDNDAFVKIGNSLARMLATNGVAEERIQKYSDRSTNSLVKLTRFLSLSMKTNNLDKAVEILDHYAVVGSLASRLHGIFSESLDMKKALCEKCKSSNVRMEEGCMHCLDCSWERCG